MFDAALIGSAGFFAGMVSLVGLGDRDPYYWYYLGLGTFPLPMLATHLTRRGKPRPAVGCRYAVVLLLVAVSISAKLTMLLDRMGQQAVVAVRDKARIVALATILAEGEPATPDLNLRADLGVDTAFYLWVEDLHQFLDDGWRLPLPTPAWSRGSGPGCAWPLACGVGSTPASSWVPGVRIDESCTVMAPGSRLEMGVIARGRALARMAGAAAEGSLRWAWQDGYGVFGFSERFETRLAVRPAPPTVRARVAVEKMGQGDLRRCGAEEAP